MSKRDYYEVLGVSRGADDAAIKSAHRKLAMKHHPDRNQGDTKSEDMLKQVNEAFDVLSDQEKRAAYDRFGHDGPAMSAGGGGFRGGAPGDIFSDLGSIFGDIFGGDVRSGGGRRGGRRGNDLRLKMRLTLEDAATGIERSVKFSGLVACTDCSGSGAAPGSKPGQCPQCHGKGILRSAQGFFAVNQTCSRCGGSGTTIGDPCKGCNGRGRSPGDRSVNVKMPAGIEDGQQMSLGGQGEPGVGGAPAGDLLILVEIDEHPLFARHGADLYCEVPVSISDAALGGKIEVATLKDKVQVKIPAGTQNGKELRIRGKGMPSLRSRGTGDLHCRVRVEVPVKLSREQQDLLERLRGLETPKSMPQRKAWRQRSGTN